MVQRGEIPHHEALAFAIRVEPVLPVGETDEVPQAAGPLGLEYVLGIDAVRQIISNAVQQRGELTNEQRLAAFLFYYDNDAFTDLDEQNQHRSLSDEQLRDLQTLAAPTPSNSLSGSMAARSPSGRQSAAHDFVKRPRSEGLLSASASPRLTYLTSRRGVSPLVLRAPRTGRTRLAWLSRSTCSWRCRPRWTRRGLDTRSPSRTRGPNAKKRAPAEAEAGS